MCLTFENLHVDETPIKQSKTFLFSRSFSSHAEYDPGQSQGTLNLIRHANDLNVCVEWKTITPKKKRKKHNKRQFFVWTSR